MEQTSIKDKINTVNKGFYKPNKLAIFLYRQELLLAHKLAETNNNSVRDILLGKGLKFVKLLQRLTGGLILGF